MTPIRPPGVCERVVHRSQGRSLWSCEASKALDGWGAQLAAAKAFELDSILAIAGRVVYGVAIAMLMLDGR